MAHVAVQHTLRGPLLQDSDASSSEEEQESEEEEETEEPREQTLVKTLSQLYCRTRWLCCSLWSCTDAWRAFKRAAHGLFGRLISFLVMHGFGIQLRGTCMQEERYMQSFSAAVTAATNTTYTAGTAAQNALSVIGTFHSVKEMCEVLQEHFQQLEEYVSASLSAACHSACTFCWHVTPV